MNFAIDNTVTDPSSLAGYFIGSTYLVPPVGAGGLWANKEDQIATWGGSVWNFTQPLAGSVWQITSGPNAGKIYTRTSTVSRFTNLIPDGNLAFDIGDYEEWDTVILGTATIDWSAGQVALATLGNTTAQKAQIKVDFTLVPGNRYRLQYTGTDKDVDGATTLGKFVLKDEDGSFIYDYTLFESEDYSFTAESANYSATWEVEALVTAGDPGTFTLTSASVTRVPELVVNGNFGSETGWDFETPWEAVDDTAFAVIDYSGHEPFPALRQTLTDLTVGSYYRVSFDVTANFTRGILSVWAGGQVLADFKTAGSHALYFKAGTTDVELAFPLTKLGISNFEVTLTSVSVIEALWFAGPVLKGDALCVATCTLAPVISRRSGLLCLATCSATMVSGKTVSPSLQVNATSSAALQTQRQRFVNALLTCSASASASMGSAKRKDVALYSKSTATASLAPQPSGRYLVRDAINAILNLWGGTGCCDDGCGGQASKEALEKLNAAMQKLSGSGKEWGFVSNVPMTLSKGASADSVALPENVLYVRRVNWLPALNAGETVFGEFALRPVTTRQELESFRASHTRDIWPLSSAESSLAPYKLPLAYFTEAENTQVGLPDRPPELRLMLAPVPTMTRTWKVQVDACIAPPRYTCKDVNDGVVLAVPHKYAETLLVPLARYYAMTSRYFTRPELADAVKEQARDALLMIGEIQPASPEASKESKPA